MHSRCRCGSYQESDNITHSFWSGKAVLGGGNVSIHNRFFFELRFIVRSYSYKRYGDKKSEGVKRSLGGVDIDYVTAARRNH